MLANAERVIVAAFGESKAEVMRAALDPASDLPVARVIRGAKRSLVLMDRAAGAGVLSSSWT